MKSLKLFALAVMSMVSTFGWAQHDQSLLWKISGNGLPTSSFLYGTIHIVCPEDMEIPESVDAAMGESEQLILELDMDEPGFMAEMQQLSVNPGMESIAGMLSEDEKALLDEFFMENYNMNMDQLGIMRPFTLLSMVFISGMDCPQPASYELHFIEEASKREWSVEGLESVKDQVAIFDQVPTEEQLGWIIDYVRNQDEFASQLQDLIAAYKLKDVDALSEIMNDYPEYEDIADDLLKNRNERWVPLIEQHIKAKPSFIAVGAAHLGSQDGLISLLREKGYTVEPVL